MRNAAITMGLVLVLATVGQAGLIDTGILDLTGADESFDGAEEFNTGVTGPEIGLDGTGPKTLVAKFNTNAGGIHTFISYSPFGGVISDEGGEWPDGRPGADLRLKLNADTDQLRFEVSGGAETLSINNLNDGQDHVVAVVVPDQSNVTAGDAYFIIDGVQFAGDGGSTTPIDTADSVILDDQGDPNPLGSLDIIVGMDQADNGMDGMIDWVAIEDEALTADQIALLPEPATMSVLAIGGLAAILRRRKR